MTEQQGIYFPEIMAQLDKGPEKALDHAGLIYQYSGFAKDLKPRFYFVADNGAVEVRPKGVGDVKVHRLEETVEEQSYALAKEIATMGDPVRIFPGNSRIKEELKKRFEELAIGDYIQENTIDLKPVYPPKDIPESSVITLDYSPLEGLADALWIEDEADLEAVTK